jgi:hypothetical protein
MRIHAPVEFHNFNYGKGRWEIYWVKTSPSRGRSQTIGADIISLAFPGRPLSFLRQWLGKCHRTNAKERTTKLAQIKLHVLPLDCPVRLMLL